MNANTAGSGADDDRKMKLSTPFSSASATWPIDVAADGGDDLLARSANRARLDIGTSR